MLSLSLEPPFLSHPVFFVRLLIVALRFHSQGLDLLTKKIADVLGDLTTKYGNEAGVDGVPPPAELNGPPAVANPYEANNAPQASVGGYNAPGGGANGYGQPGGGYGQSGGYGGGGAQDGWGGGGGNSWS